MKLASASFPLLLALVAMQLPAQENSIRMDGGESWKGLSILFTPKVEPDPDGASNKLGGTVIDLLGGVVGQRFIDDRAHKHSFGYDVRLEPSADGRSAQIRVEPLHAARHAVQNGWTQFGVPMGLPKYPVVPDLRVGDTVALDLLINPATGQKIVDYLTLVRSNASIPNASHDLSLADIQLQLHHPRVWTNGKPLESTFFQGESEGNVVWIYLQGHGRFVLSLLPNKKLGFQKNGIAFGSTLNFQDDSTDFRVECDRDFAPAEGVFNLYILHEPAWKPHSPSDVIEVGVM